MRENKNIDSSEITVIFLKAYKKCKTAELLTKTSFFYNLGTILKMAKEKHKGDVESICARVTKHASKKVAKAEVNLT